MTNMTKLNLDLLLPEVPDPEDRCIQRLAELLQTKAGIDSAHSLTTDDGKHQMRVHFDPSQVSVSEVRS